MGDEVALGDPVLRADAVDVSLDHSVHVAESAAVVPVALDCFFPGLSGWDELERHEAWVPAEAAIGLAAEGEGEARLGVSEQEREVVER